MPLPSELPIAHYKTELQAAVAQYPVLLVVGETGSGKTTQLPQYLLELPYLAPAVTEAVAEVVAEASHADTPPAGGPRAPTPEPPPDVATAAVTGRPARTSTPPVVKPYRIAVTQPRRLAAVSVATRVAQEQCCRLGDRVGYTIRFEDVSSPATLIKYMTDGILVRECMEDPLLRHYDVVVLDEAHERSLETDILFGLLKRAVRERGDLKLVVMSATLDAGHFSAYFDECPVFMIPGRTFDVAVYYNSEMNPADLRAKYVQYAFETVMYIHREDILGDVLVFLTGTVCRSASPIARP